MRRIALSLTGLFVAVLLLSAAPVKAAPIVCCSISSDGTPASLLAATFDFTVVGTELFLTVTNDTVAPDGFNINQIFFDTLSNVTSLALTVATHSDGGTDVLGDWLPVETNVMANGFMPAFDFAVRDGMGETDPSVIGPGEHIDFTFDISGTGPFAMSDFGPRVAAKFVSGPDDPEAPGSQDSAFGTVPEPTTALLLTVGLAAGMVRRRR